MGIDLLYINYEIESTFEIAFSSDEFMELAVDGDITVGDLYAAILKKKLIRDNVRTDIGLNFRLWQYLQNVIRQTTDVDLDRVQLRTPLKDIFPRQQRRVLWQTLREQCHFDVPELEYPSALRTIAFGIAAISAFFEVFHIMQIPGIQWIWPLASALGVWLLIETYTKFLTIFSSWRTAFPRDMRTVKDLCRFVLNHNCEALCRKATDEKIPVSPEVWRKLVGVLVDSLGVDEDEVTSRARLIADLGMQ